jgi:hypothetical protein
VSKAAWKHVRQLEAQRSDGLTGAEVRVLRAVASYHHVGVACSFATVAALAAEAQMSVRHFRRLAGELCVKGVLRRHSAQRDCNGSQTSNEYELVGLDDAGASAEVRSRVFNVKRTRREFQQTPKAVQMRLPKAAGHADEFRNADSFASLRNDKRDGEENQNTSLEPAPALCKSVGFVRGEGDTMSGEPRTPCPPVESYEEWNEGIETPYAPLCDAQGVDEKLPDRGDWPPGPAAEAHGAPVAGASRANVLRFPVRQRRRRGLQGGDAPVLDGFEHVLREETSRVLRECGVSPVSASRKTREAVSEQLRLRCESSGRGAGDVAHEAIASWAAYRSVAQVLAVTVGLRRFFVDGLVFDAKVWPWTREARENFRMAGRM